ncbi:MAG: DUF4178 domain-containing protein [Candidatus Hydrogenedentota bacterium]|nr:MAG: DUF4178 domain-containing protein [Candidatus Hydrogenedentota bacterium]
MKKAKSFSCPNCGSPIDLRFPEKTLSVTCNSCGSILDTSEDVAKIIQAFKEKQQVKPTIPVGSRATFEGQPFEVAGYMLRKDFDGSRWEEYLLFNPYLGYRWLSHWAGHWNYIRIIPNFPVDENDQVLPPERARGNYTWNKKEYTYFSDYRAKPVYVLGEFNYKVSLEEIVKVYEYINPPESITAESYRGEVVWSHATYVEPKKIAQAFQKPELNRKPSGVASNQVNPYKGKTKWAILLAFGLTLLAGFVSYSFESRYEKKIIQENTLVKNTRGLPVKREGNYRYYEISQELGEVEFKKKQNFRFQLKANVDNSWVYATIFVIDEAKNKGVVFTKEISYYWGYDDGESWSEGSQEEELITRTFPPGKYFLFATFQTNIKGDVEIHYKIDTDYPPTSTWFVLNFLWIWAFPFFIFAKKLSFEKRRNGE